MAHTEDEGTIAYPQVFTLHWEGPPLAEVPAEVAFHDERMSPERDGVEGEFERSEQGRALWEQIRREAEHRGDAALWRRKLSAYWWVKMETRGTAGDYARRFEVNHATVRTWISEVAKLAYQVGYRLHEDRLLLVGEAPEGLQHLRKIVNHDAGSDEAWSALGEAEAEFRGEDPYFHLNEGHVLRARGRLRDSDETLKEGLAIAEARPLRSVLWNARGQTFWDCDPQSSFPLPDHLERAEKAFRRAAILDQSTYFPFVNLAQLAVDAGDFRRAEYWLGELSAARRGMEEAMQDDLARYLDQAEWSEAVAPKRFWKSGPLRWLKEAAAKGVLALAAFVFVSALAAPPASAESGSDAPTVLERSSSGSSRGGGARGGAGGN
jgi:tetratricopeptide (TPR) repeat protein